MGAERIHRLTFYAKHMTNLANLEPIAIKTNAMRQSFHSQKPKNNLAI
jgi:hypothetical protein